MSTYNMEAVRQVMILSIFIQLLLCASRQDSHLDLFFEHEIKVSEHLYCNKTDVSNLLRY